MIRRAWHALTSKVAARCARICARRPPDFVVGGMDNPYLLRWYVTPWRRWFLDPATGKTREGLTGWRRWAAAVTSRLPNLYLHVFLRPDDDRALHDHPWAWVSWLLSGTYIEHTIGAGGIRHQRTRQAGSLRAAFARGAHRVDLQALPVDGPYPRGLHFAVFAVLDCGLISHLHHRPAMTLFLTGIRTRNWGFHCPEAGWVPWEKFTDPATAGSTVGRGCDQ